MKKPRRLITANARQTEDAQLDSASFGKRFVAFLDVLGFAQLTLRADQDPAARKTISGAIGVLRGANNDRRDSGYQFTHFSDSIVLTADVSAAGARAIFESCCRLYLELLNRGLLLRGGLTVGNVMHEQDGMLYGSGMIEAYKLDERGIPPRIAVTLAASDALDHVATSPFRRRYVCTDDHDLSPMMNVLERYARLNADRIAKLPNTLRRANRAAHTISTHAADMTMDPETRAKWRWLRAYWNRSIDRQLVDAAP